MSHARKIRNVCLTLSRPHKKGAKETEENPPNSTEGGVNPQQFDDAHDYNQACQGYRQANRSPNPTNPPLRTDATQNHPRADPTSERGEGRGSSSIPCPRWRSPWLEPGGAARRGRKRGGGERRGEARRGLELELELGGDLEWVGA